MGKMQKKEIKGLIVRKTIPGVKTYKPGDIYPIPKPTGDPTQDRKIARRVWSLFEFGYLARTPENAELIRSSWMGMYI